MYNNTAVGSGGGWGDVIELGRARLDGTVVANNLAVLLDGRKGFDNLLGWSSISVKSAGVPSQRVL